MGELLPTIQQTVSTKNNELGFYDFARLLHQSETAGAGRAMMALLDETPDGRQLVDTLRRIDERERRTTHRRMSNPKIVDKSQIAPALLDIWSSAQPDDKDFASVENVTMALENAQTDGVILVSDEDFLHIIDAVEKLGVMRRGIISLDGFWHVMEPLVDDSAQDYSESARSDDGTIPRLSMSNLSNLRTQTQSIDISTMNDLPSKKVPSAELPTYKQIFTSFKPEAGLASVAQISFAVRAVEMQGDERSPQEELFTQQLSEELDQAESHDSDISFEEFVGLVQAAEESTAAAFSGGNWKVSETFLLRFILSSHDQSMFIV